jgi:hypothetical protein
MPKARGEWAADAERRQPGRAPRRASRRTACSCCRLAAAAPQRRIRTARSLAGGRRAPFRRREPARCTSPSSSFCSTTRTDRDGAASYRRVGRPIASSPMVSSLRGVVLVGTRVRGRWPARLPAVVGLASTPSAPPRRHARRRRARTLGDASFRSPRCRRGGRRRARGPRKTEQLGRGSRALRRRREPLLPVRRRSSPPWRPARTECTPLGVDNG